MPVLAAAEDRVDHACERRADMGGERDRVAGGDGGIRRPGDRAHRPRDGDPAPGKHLAEDGGRPAGGVDDREVLDIRLRVEGESAVRHDVIGPRLAGEVEGPLRARRSGHGAVLERVERRGGLPLDDQRIADRGPGPDVEVDRVVVEPERADGRGVPPEEVVAGPVAAHVVGVPEALVGEKLAGDPREPAGGERVCQRLEDRGHRRGEAPRQVGVPAAVEDEIAVQDAVGADGLRPVDARPPRVALAEPLERGGGDDELEVRGGDEVAVGGVAGNPASGREIPHGHAPVGARERARRDVGEPRRERRPGYCRVRFGRRGRGRPAFGGRRAAVGSRHDLAPARRGAGAERRAQGQDQEP